MPEERLQKVLAEAGVASRRGSEALIVAGRVTVDGRPAILGERIDPDVAAVAVDGRPVVRQATPRVYVALNKPAGVTSTTRDPHARRTVIDLVPADVRRRAGRLYPVGRLDRDSEGLILLTNDGDWTDRILHPSHAVEREYAAGVRRALSAEERRELEHGIELDEGLATVAHLRPMTSPEVSTLAMNLDPQPGPLAWYRVTLTQGWKRQVRRMFAALGVPVERLVRVRVGTLRLGDLRPGATRLLSARDAMAVATPAPAPTAAPITASRPDRRARR